MAERVNAHFDEMSAALKDANKQARMGKVEELKAAIKANDFTYAEVPVQIVYTDYSRSKGQSIINAVNIAFDMLLRKVGR